MKGSSDSINRDEVSKRFTHCCAFSSLGERLATFQKKRLMSRRQNKNMMMPPSATPAQLYKKQTAVCGYVQCHNGNQRQRRKKGLHHRQQNGHKGAKPLKARQQRLPVFQCSKLVHPAHQCGLHPVSDPFLCSGAGTFPGRLHHA